MKCFKIILSSLLFTCMCVCAYLGFKKEPISTKAASATATYTDTFDYVGYQPELFYGGLWSNGDRTRQNGTLPTVEGGVAKFTTKQNVEFNWKSLTQYSSTKTYTFEFDFKVTDVGSGAIWDSTDCTRALYVAFGGYYNLIEIPSADGNVKLCGTTKTLAQSTYLNVNLHAKLVLVGTTCTATIYNSSNAEIASGSRTKAEFTSTTDINMPYLGFRCEDGAVQIDNFTFTDGTVKYIEDFSGTPLQGDIESISLWTKGDRTREGDLPTIESGVANFATKQNVEFNWKKLTQYDSTKTYTFEFDFKVTNVGSGASWNSTDCTRALYVAFGGYYNLIEIPSADGNVKLCGTTKTLAQSTYLNVNLHAKLVLVGTTCTATIYNSSNAEIASGSRTKAEFTSTTDAYMPYLGIRCEDGAVQIDNFTFTDGTNTYKEDFALSNSNQYMDFSGVWTRADQTKTTAYAPTLGNGTLKLNCRESVEFNWQKLTQHDTAKTYTFEFDFKITNVGDGTTWGGDAYTRALYVSFGGWYNQIEIPTSDGRIRAGDTYKTVAESIYKNVNLHAKVILEGSTVTTAIFDANNNLVISGNRTKSEYSNLSDIYMPYFALRCEDGAVQIDNFKFYEDTIKKVATTSLNITSGKYAKYTSTLVYDGSKKTSIRLNNTEIFAISPEAGMVIGGSVVLGTYGQGNYTINTMVNTEQKMVLVEVGLPGGGILRRGSYNLLPTSSSYSIIVYSFADSSVIKNASVTYSSVSKNSYTINSTEPTATGFGANVYNIVTSFNDATSTRNFAFTAKTSYVNGATMAVKYRVKGTSTWTKVNAVKESESINSTEDFYKADVTGLKANTEYEYKVGKKDSTNETNDWSKTYTFKTATGKEQEFSFVAVGDTQGVTWNGTDEPTKGFMYAQAAIIEAMQEVSNPAFMLHTGDFVEGERSDLATQWNLFFKALGDYGATIPFFGTIGNHDTYQINTSTGDNYFDLHFNNPNNGGASALESTYTSQITNTNLKALIKKLDESIYSYNYGDAHIVVLASGNYSSEDRLLLEAQRKWLEADLKANECARWKIIMVHEPVYHRIGGSESRPWLYDVIESYGVDLLIQGHSHVVTRTYPIKNGKIVSKTVGNKITKGTGTVYTTIGSTAYNHDGLGNPNLEEMMVIATSQSVQPTYATVSITNNKLVMTVKQIDGYVMDTFEIVAGSSDTTNHTGTLTLQGKTSATCTTNGYTGDKICSKCGRAAEYGTVIKATGHTFTKQDTNSKYLKSGATCTAKAVYYKSCETCGLSSKGQTGEATFTSGSVLSHTFTKQDTNSKYLKSGATCTAKAVYYKSCETCGLSSKGQTGEATFTSGSVLSHTFTKQDTNSKYLKSSATCTAKAVYYKSCETCGLSSKGQTGEATFTSGSVLSHTFTKQDTNSKYLKSGATCTAKAVYYKSCETCGLSSKGQTGEATFTSGSVLSHTFTKQDTNSKYLKSSATCTAKAVYYKSCEACGLSSKGQTGEATFTSGSVLSHTFTKQDTADKYLKSGATCTAKAVYYKSCETCGLSSKGQTGEATFTSGNFANHNYVEETIPNVENIVSGATCEEPAVYNKICSACGVKGTETYTYGNSLGHDMEYISVGENGHYQTCKNKCGASTTTKAHEYEGDICKYCGYEREIIISSSSSLSVSSSSTSVITSASQKSSISVSTQTQSSNTSATTQASSTQTPSVSQEQSSISSAISPSTQQISSNVSTITSGEQSEPLRGNSGCGGNINGLVALPIMLVGLLGIIKIFKKKEN